MNPQLCTGSLALILCLPLIAQGQPATRPAPAQQPKIIEQVNYDNTPLDDVVRDLNTVGTFQVVLAGGIQNHYPLVTLDLKEVTAEQVLRVLEKQLGLRVEPAGSPPIYVVSFPKMDANTPGPAFHVTAYCLTPIIDELSSRRYTAAKLEQPTTQPANETPKTRKGLMNDVVSVVETAVKMAPDQTTATMIEVHEPTEMLVVKGTPEQREAAESVLRALEPRPGTVVKGEPPR